MKLSTRSRYGLRALVDLAAETKETDLSINIKTIASRQGISDFYLEQLFTPLKKSGFITSERGAKGGYRLNKNPEDITVGDILRSLEGDLSPVDCLSDTGATCGGSKCQSCVTKGVWEKLYAGINDVVDSITLKQLADDYLSAKETAL
ncbi:MAG: Rrf2 family transcriptional regulator [Clostridiales bacterium]|jgi:Rrf2 family protein|nr:Rrf2 family transcriptional regulator [Clostridiales bacterium]